MLMRLVILDLGFVYARLAWTIHPSWTSYKVVLLLAQIRSLSKIIWSLRKLGGLYAQPLI